jgi:HK97 family phage portal protein
MKLAKPAYSKSPLFSNESRASLENPAFSLSDPGILSALGLYPSGGGAGRSITPEAAMRTSAVYSCVRVISESIGAIPCHVYERTGPKSRRLATDVAQYALLHDTPNTFQTPFVFKMTLGAQCSLWGNFVALIVRTKGGDPLELVPVAAKDVEIRFDVATRRKRFKVNGLLVDDGEVIHVPALGWDGLVGLSPIAQARNTIGNALAADEFMRTFVENGTKLAGVLQHPDKLGEDALKHLRESWTQIYAGAMNAGKVAILEEGMSFKELTMPLEDAQFIESRKFSVSDIARIFRVPPHMIGDLEKATFSNIEQQSIDFVTHTLMPWLVRIEEEFNRKLFIRGDERSRFYAKFNADALQRGDMKSRYDAYRIGREASFLCPDDIRALEDLDPVPNGKGQGFIEPLNFKPLGSVTPPAVPPKPETKEGNA